MNRRLLFVIGSLDIGGAERHLVQILPELAQRGWHVEVYCTNRKGLQSEILQRKGICVRTAPFVRCKNSARPLEFFRLPVILASLAIHLVRTKPSIVHFFLPESYLLGGLCTLALGGSIRVMSRRSLNDYQTARPLLAWIERVLHGQMHAILGNSSAVVRQLIQEGVSGDRLGLIYNGIDLTPFSMSKAKSRVHVREELHIPKASLVFIMVANIIPYKGHADLIEGLRLVVGELPQPWRILMVGRGGATDRNLIDRAEAAGISENILWLGGRSDVIDLLYAADIGILCSHQEGFSNAILEAMAASLPMIVTDVGGNAEAVVDGLTGRVVPVRDPRRLGDAIREMALNPDRDKMGRQGRLRIEKLFSILNCVDRYQALYTALLTGQHSKHHSATPPNEMEIPIRSE